MRNEYLIHVVQCIGNNLDSYIIQFREKDTLSVSRLEINVIFAKKKSGIV